METIDQTELSQVTITSDGAVRGNPGPGGWAALLERSGSEKLLSGGDPGPTTNNAMELEAVIQAFQALRRPCQVLLRCDSQYVLGGIERLLRGDLIAEGRKNGGRWLELAELLPGHSLTLQWVRGHNGDARNERVDRAANAAANGFVLVAPPLAAESKGQVWSLALLSPGTGRPSRWALRAGSALESGEVLTHRETQATAVYRALLAGMQAALALPGVEAITLDVVSNFELLIKQLNGEWRVKNPAQAPLASEAAELRAGFAAVRFTHRSTEAVTAMFKV